MPSPRVLARLFTRWTHVVRDLTIVGTVLAVAVLGGHCTDPEDLPAENAAYALRDLQRLVRAAARHGHNVGIYTARLLGDSARLPRDKLPWTRMRQVYRLLGLAKRYGSELWTPRAAGRSPFDVVPVTKIAPVLEAAGTKNTPASALRAAQARTPARFARESGEFRRVKPYWKVIDGGATDGGAAPDGGARAGA